MPMNYPDPNQPRLAVRNQAPEGFLQDAHGRLNPASLVRPIDSLRDQTVLHLVDQALHLQKALAAFKQAAFADIAAFVQASAEQWQIDVGGTKGNVTLRSYDGRYKVERSIQEHVAFDERLQHAKTLIDECINDWSTGSQPELRILVNDAFQVDKEGRVSTNRVLGLKRHDIRAAKWLQAMEAIAQSVQVVGSRSYVRVYERVGDSDKYTQIALDLAAV